MNSFRSLIYAILLYLSLLCTVCFAVGQPAATPAPITEGAIARFVAAKAGGWKPRHDTTPAATQLCDRSSRHTAFDPDACRLASAVGPTPETLVPAEWRRP